MEDVIFAGTSGRAPLGRAEVSLTIDNSDGALPIDYSEVTISRRHVPLRAARSTRSTAPPAGCSTSRSCSATRASAARCTSSSARASSTRSCTRRPRSAAASSRRPPASSSTASARRRRSASSTRCRPTSRACRTSPPSCAASSRRWASRPRWPAGPASSRPTCATPRLRLLADDLHTLTDAVRAGDRRRVRGARAPGRWWRPSWPTPSPPRPCARPRPLADAPALTAAQETWFALSGLRERLAGTVGHGRRARAQPRPRARGGAARARTRGAWRPRPRAMRGQEADLDRAVEEQRDALSMAVSVRTAAEAALATAEQELRAAVRAASDRREGVVRLQGQVNAARSRAEARASEIERLRSQAAGRPRARHAGRPRVPRRSRRRSPGSTRARWTSTRASSPPQSALSAVDDQIAELAAARVARWSGPAPAWPPGCEALAPMIAVADASGELAGGAVPGVLRDAGPDPARRARLRGRDRRGPRRGGRRCRWLTGPARHWPPSSGWPPTTADARRCSSRSWARRDRAGVAVAAERGAVRDRVRDQRRPARRPRWRPLLDRVAVVDGDLVRGPRRRRRRAGAARR